MRAFLGLMVANLRMMSRSRAMLFWNFAFPVLFIFLLGTAFGQSARFSARVGVEGTSASVTMLTDALHRVKGLTIIKVKHGRTEMRQGKLDLFVQANLQHVKIWQNHSSISGVATQMVSGTLMALNLAHTGQKPYFQVQTKSLAGKGQSYIDFLIPGVIGMMLMNTGLFGGIQLITYRRQGILRRLRGTPLPTFTFILARILTQFLMVLFQVMLLYEVSTLFFGFSPAGSVWSLVPLVMVGSLAFLTLGFFVAGISSSMEVASAVTNVISLPMTFLAGVFYPVSNLPKNIQWFVDFLPLRYLTSGLRQAVIHGTPTLRLWPDVWPLGVTVLVGSLLAVKFFSWEAPRA